jgi:hypothetical protein
VTVPLLCHNVTILSVFASLLFTLHQAMKAQRERRGAILFFLSTRRYKRMDGQPHASAAAFVQSRKTPVIFVKPVRLSFRVFQRVFQWTLYVKFDTGDLYENLSSTFVFG